jgi:hypothetical protein
LLRDIESACAGRTPPAPARAQALALLRDMAVAAAARPSARPGFVLEIARNMLGEAEPLFQELARCRTLHQAAERLGELRPEGET